MNKGASRFNKSHGYASSPSGSAVKKFTPVSASLRRDVGVGSLRMAGELVGHPGTSIPPRPGCRCPNCGCPLKAKNLARHVRKVHGKGIAAARRGR